MNYFVNQKKQKDTGAWDTGTHVKATLDEAFHQFHAFMSTYAYGQAKDLIYVGCTIETDAGEIIANEFYKPEEVAE